MRKNINGFTAVELIIVSVVIGILCIVTSIAYSGAVQKSRTSQTAQTAEKWLAAIQLHKVRIGSYPSESGCLGENYGYGESGTMEASVGQCRQDDQDTGILQNTALDSALVNYISGKPTPSFITASNSSTDWRRGLYYRTNSNSAEISFVVEGSQTPATCPVISYIAASSSKVFNNGNSECTYSLGVLKTD